jgi:hypothetical protein
VLWWPRIVDVHVFRQALRAFALMGIIALAWHGNATVAWTRYLDSARRLLASAPGFIEWAPALAKLPAGEQRVLRRFNNDWVLEAMSLVLAPGGRLTTVVGQAGVPGWRPFDPFQLAQYRASRFWNMTPYLEAVAKQVMTEQGVQVPYLFGTMIEIPRAALTAAEIAEYAQFFSFGTNDLTQMTFGFSRDDAEGKFLKKYVEDKILPSNVFETIDTIGVGRLMKLAVTEGRAARANLKCGICGEHGGDPESIYFCHEIGLDYVSCSPFRVPIARLSAAQAAIRERVKVSIDK